MEDKLLKFVKVHRRWTTEGWSKLLFGDELPIHQFAVQERIICWFKGKGYDPNYTIATIKHPLTQLILGHAKQSYYGIVLLTTETIINEKNTWIYETPR